MVKEIRWEGEYGKRKANWSAAQMQISAWWSSTSCRPRCFKVEMDQNLFVGSFKLGSGLSLRT
jgi:hypothetical protein